jgi:hypothetical protein
MVIEPERKQAHGKFGRRWDDNIKMDLVEIRCEVVDWF